MRVFVAGRSVPVVEVGPVAVIWVGVVSAFVVLVPVSVLAVVVAVAEAVAAEGGFEAERGS